ncbi:hypothetical protein GPECTOR_1g727 [Gonium pectorale]|uniref:Uncharacterized protein n=1 Tax=Gonium pectorale TaxID=33097 RepID=A0A150H3T0_GONPE|nr:hypothetical protein GPECTOR_1g727 [Gonium pectorale]|eukprot:KXZ56807.1 hypothetical protein GPECTOR_1g727 [Gonium pectorale]
MVSRWTAGQQSAVPAASWAAHRGPAACLAKAQSGADLLLLSGGDDGHVRGWRLSQVLQQMQQRPAAAASAAIVVSPELDVKLPRAEGPLGALSLPPAVQALALAGAGAAGGAPTLFVGSGREAAGGAESLRCLRSQPASCLRFESSGSWLLVGQGNAWATANGAAGGPGPAAGAGQGDGGSRSSGGSLGMWDLRMMQRAKQAPAGFTPQALSLLPSEVLLAGSGPRLARFSLALEALPPTPLPATASAFALDVHPDSGALAVGGTGGVLEILSKYGKKTGGVSYTSEED